MPVTREQERTTSPARRERRPVLLFFTQRTSGPSRRMKSLVAWLHVTRKAQLRVVDVDVDLNRRLAERFGVETTPTLVLLVDRRPVARLVGRVSGKQIDEMLEPFTSPRDATRVDDAVSGS